MSAARRALAAIATLAFGAVGAALVTQYGFEMLPCPWCILQRLLFVVIGLVALAGLALPAAAARTGAALLVVAAAGAGVAAALWQHFVAAASASCNLTFADRAMAATGLPALWPQVFEAKASCADAAVRLFGLPYEFWSLGLFVLLGVLAIRAARR